MVKGYVLKTPRKSEKIKMETVRRARERHGERPASTLSTEKNTVDMICERKERESVQCLRKAHVIPGPLIPFRFFGS